MDVLPHEEVMGSTCPQLTIPVQVRWMIRKDMEPVLSIENRSFEHPWCEEDFLNCMRQRNCIGMVAEDDRDMIVGFVVYDLLKDQLRILNMAVDPNYLRRGVGTAIINRLIAKLSQQRRTQIVLDIRETNIGMQKFLSSLSFLATGVLKSPYEEIDEDAYQFCYSIPACP